MTMVITLSFLELESQTSSSLEDDGIGHSHLHNSSLRKGGRWPWSSFPVSRPGTHFGFAVVSCGLYLALHANQIVEVVVVVVVVVLVVIQLLLRYERR